MVSERLPQLPSSSWPLLMDAPRELVNIDSFALFLLFVDLVTFIIHSGTSINVDRHYVSVSLAVTFTFYTWF